jgi:apolipoprotein N-acyltransferase
VGTVLRLAVSALAGLAAAGAFEPLAWAILLVPAVAGLSVALHGLRGRRAFAVGLVFGIAFMAALLPWIQVIGVDAWIGLSLLQAAFFGILAVALTRVAALPWWPVWAAACWVAVELLRSLVPWGGFPWGRLAFATIDTPLAPAMGIVGTGGTTFVIALLGTTVAWLLLGGHRHRATASTVAVGVVAVAATPALVAAGLPEPEAGRTVRVAAVQGNVPGEGMDAFSERRAVLDNHVRATLELAEKVAAGDTERPEFVLWPENSTDIDPFGDVTVYADIQRAADAMAVPILVGAMVDGEEPGDVRNEGIVWQPGGATGGGPGERYAKTHPVPFGEYIPMRDQLAKLFERLDQIPRDMVPGTEPGVLDLAGTTIGDVICFEVAYDGLVHEVVDGGAELLVVQTNNATYMGTSQIEQQFAISRLRAVETSRYVVVVATNGVSGIIAPDGSVVERAAVRDTVVMQQDIPLRTVVTLGVRIGRWVEIGLVAVAVVAVVVAVARGRHLRRRIGSDA